MIRRDKARWCKCWRLRQGKYVHEQFEVDDRGSRAEAHGPPFDPESGPTNQKYLRTSTWTDPSNLHLESALYALRHQPPWFFIYLYLLLRETYKGEIRPMSSRLGGSVAASQPRLQKIMVRYCHCDMASSSLRKDHGWMMRSMSQAIASVRAIHGK